MLNRVKKNLITAVLAGTMCLALPSFAVDSTISYININNLAYQDVEIAIDNTKILVPFKQLADLFDIKYTANRVDKHIGFVTYDGQQGVINQNGVFINDIPLWSGKPVFISQGLMDGVFNEAYIPAEIASEVMGVTLETDFETLTIVANVERDIPLIKNLTNDANALDKGPHAYQDITAPKKRGKITLNTIGLRSNLLSDNLSIRPQPNSRKYINDTFAGFTQISFNGDLLDGKYRIEGTEYHYRQDAFMFGGLTGTYMNTIKDPDTGKDKFFYELGKVTGRSDIDASIGTSIFGAQIWNYNYRKDNPRDLHGYVKPTSLVRLTVNDLEPMTLSTYAGYYSLKEVQLPNPVKKIKLEEINEDGTVELIAEERYSIYGNDTPFEKEERSTAYAGVWGYQDRLFREGAHIYRGNNKKMTAGAAYQYGIKDNVTFESKVTADKIYEKTNSKIIYQIPTNDSLLVTGTQKSVNYQEGVTSLNSIEWKSDKMPNVKARGTAGVSAAHDIREHESHGGFTVKGTGEYVKDIDSSKAKGIFKPRRIFGKLELFHNSPDFYIASTDSTSKNDRTGGRVSGGLSFNQTNASGSYAKWVSNTNHRYKGGAIEFDEAYANAQTKIPKFATAKFNANFRHGENDLGKNKNYHYDAGLVRDFDKYARLQLGKRESVYDTRYYNPTLTDRNYKSKYSDIYTQLDVPIPNNWGRVTAAHDFVRYKTLNYKNGYNTFKFGYTFPTWKRVTFGFGWGFRYHGQHGNDLYANIGYRSRAGQFMNVNYSYSQNGGYFIDNMFMPTTNRHSVNFVLNDAFQLFHNGFKSVGDEDWNKGIFEAIAFVDVNKNGKYDKKVDVPVKDVSLITSWTGEVNVTNKRGRVCSLGLEQGVYNVSIDMRTLPITVAPLTNDMISRKVKIDGGQTTQLEIPLISTVGSISGVLKISDEFDRKLKLNEFIVVILDENGTEVSYSTLGEEGDFYISGLAPGKYTVRLDENFVNAYGLEEVADKSVIDVVIPYDYENPTDITDLDLEYKTIAL